MKFGTPRLKACLAAVTLLAVASLAQATPTYYFGNLPDAGGVFPTDTNSPPLAVQAAFNGAVDVTLTETFESRAVGSLNGAAYTPKNQMEVLGAGNLLSQTLPPGLPNEIGAAVKSGAQANGRFNTTGGAASGKWLETDWDFIITLATKVEAFAFFGTDFGDFDGNLKIALYDGNTLIDDNVFTDGNNNPLEPRGTGNVAQNGSLLFFGYSSSVKFDKIVFDITQPAVGQLDYLGIDDLRVGNLKAVTNPTPEPGSLALAGLALFAAGWARRARRVA